MTNAKSILSMKLAHKLFKSGKDASFGECLRYAWRIIKANITAALLMLKRSHTTYVDVCRHLITGATILAVKVERRFMGLFKRVVGTYETESYNPWDVKILDSYTLA